MKLNVFVNKTKIEFRANGKLPVKSQLNFIPARKR